MKIIYETVTGSRLHGTDDENSDTDIKGIYIPKGRDILLNRVAPSIRSETNPNKANGAEDVDKEYYSLLTFLTKVGEGDINALDVFFSPTQTHGHMEYIRAHQSNLIVKGENQNWARFVRSMRGKYGSTIARTQSLGATVTILEQLCGYKFNDTSENAHRPLGDFDMTLRAELSDLSHVKFVDFPVKSGSEQLITYLEVCGKKYAYTASLKGAYLFFKNLRNMAANRAEKVPTPEEWSDIAHTIRIADQSIEMLDTGKITFPRWNADYLRRVKAGLEPYEETAEFLDYLADKLSNHIKYSSLPEKPDTEWIEQFVMSVYSEQIRLEVYRNTL